MPAEDRTRLVRDCFAAYETGDRQAIEGLLADDLTFSSPADVGIDRATYFERCWPAAGTLESFDFKRLYEVGDEVVVTYEARRRNGDRFRNTEVFGFEEGKVRTVEVYFGWNL
jgi:ketosteroid isomerase-like protein